MRKPFQGEVEPFETQADLPFQAYFSAHPTRLDDAVDVLFVATNNPNNNNLVTLAEMVRLALNIGQDCKPPLKLEQADVKITVYRNNRGALAKFNNCLAIEIEMPAGSHVIPDAIVDSTLPNNRG